MRSEVLRITDVKVSYLSYNSIPLTSPGVIEQLYRAVHLYYPPHQRAEHRPACAPVGHDRAAGKLPGKNQLLTHISPA